MHPRPPACWPPVMPFHRRPPPCRHRRRQEGWGVGCRRAPKPTTHLQPRVRQRRPPGRRLRGACSGGRAGVDRPHLRRHVHRGPGPARHDVGRRRPRSWRWLCQDGRRRAAVPASHVVDVRKKAPRGLVAFDGQQRRCIPHRGANPCWARACLGLVVGRGGGGEGPVIARRGWVSPMTS